MKSIVYYPERGEGGRNSYRGNCSPKLIEDIISQYKIKQLSDFMVGGGTTLSCIEKYEDFVQTMNYCTLKQFAALEKGGRFFILMGDIKKQGKLYSMLCDIAKPGTMEQIIIKAQHNCWSDTRE